MTVNNVRTAQKKGIGDKSFYIILPIKETGIHPGDNIMFEVAAEGTILLRKMKKEEVEKKKSIGTKVLEILGLHEDYEIKEREQTDMKNNTSSINVNNANLVSD